MSLIRIKSFHPLTEFSPSWNIPIWLTQWSEPEKVDTVRKTLEDDEENILKEFDYAKSGGTGLGPDDVTTRFGKYNIFSRYKDIPEVNGLLKFLQYSYLQYVTTQQVELKELKIVCWANVMKQGQKMESHAHGSQPDSYLSGNMHLDDYQSKTTYHSPYDVLSKISLPNQKGGNTLFPSYCPHFTDEHDEAKKRVSLAYDLRLKGTFNEDEFKCVDFMNQSILDDVNKKRAEELAKQKKEVDTNK